MSLLLDALKKSQPQAESHLFLTPEISLEELVNQDALEPIEEVRSGAQNLFAAKAPAASTKGRLPRRNLLFTLGGTVLLLVIGTGWYIASAGSNTLLSAAPMPLAPEVQPVAASQPLAVQVAPVPAEPNDMVNIAKTQEAPQVHVSAAATPQPQGSTIIRIEQQREASLDALLNDAYLAYRDGRLDEAQQLYLAIFYQEERNVDALLGLAAIAQQRGENLMAAQYYSRVLSLDPRNATANAGMSALSTDERSESRLKTLLRVQRNSASLHFALGNLYAEQSRWNEAQQTYFSAYMLEPGSAEYAYNLAVSLDHMGQNKLAAQYYQRAIQSDPSHSAGFDHVQISQRVQELTQ